MTTSSHDPNLRWDGRQWLRWTGAGWVPAAAPGPFYPPNPAVAQPQSAAYAAQPYAAGYLTDKHGKNVQATIAWVLTVLTLGYMLPWAIAATRGKSNAGMIGIVNFFAGWTVIGWIAALVMACSAHQIAAAGTNVTVMNANAVGYPGWPPPTAPPAWGNPPSTPGPQPPYTPGPPPGRPNIEAGGASADPTARP